MAGSASREWKNPGAMALTRMPCRAPRGGQLARQPHQAGLGRGVSGVVRAAHRRVQPGDRGDVDDASVLSLQHLAPGGLREQKCAGQVDVEHLLPLVERHRLGALAPGDASVVDEDVDLAERLHGRVHDRLHVGGLGDVGHHAFDAVRRWPRSRSTVGVSHSSRRAQSISAAPASASPSAISSPRPREPPVTMATRPGSLNKSWMEGMCARYTSDPRSRIETRQRGTKTGGRGGAGSGGDLAAGHFSRARWMPRTCSRGMT